jgi:hypothetical protein
LREPRARVSEDATSASRDACVSRGVRLVI